MRHGEAAVCAVDAGAADDVGRERASRRSGALGLVRVSERARLAAALGRRRRRRRHVVHRVHERRDRRARPAVHRTSRPHCVHCIASSSLSAATTLDVQELLPPRVSRRGAWLVRRVAVEATDAAHDEEQARRQGGRPVSRRCGGAHGARPAVGRPRHHCALRLAQGASSARACARRACCRDAARAVQGPSSKLCSEFATIDQRWPLAKSEFQLWYDSRAQVSALSALSA